MKQGKSIILVGMPGCGKTTTGKFLAEKTKLPFFDLDDLIEKKENRKITEIFKTDGEKYFRNLETNTIKELDCSASFILSTGGGTVENPYNMELLKKIGKVFYLEISPDIIFNRIKDDKSRPLLQKEDPKKVLFEIFSRRKFNYELSDFKISANLKTDEIACEIIKNYEKACC